MLFNGFLILCDADEINVFCVYLASSSFKITLFNTLTIETVKEWCHHQIDENQIQHEIYVKFKINQLSRTKVLNSISVKIIEFA